MNTHGNGIPVHEIQTVITWMKDQMYGEERTIWSSGNEYDRMLDAAGFLSGLIPQDEQEGRP